MITPLFKSYSNLKRYVNENKDFIRTYYGEYGVDYYAKYANNIIHPNFTATKDGK